MKVILFNGSPNVHGCTYTALHEIEETLQKNGIETEVFQVGSKSVRGCIGIWFMAILRMKLSRIKKVYISCDRLVKI